MFFQQALESLKDNPDSNFIVREDLSAGRGRSQSALTLALLVAGFVDLKSSSSGGGPIVEVAIYICNICNGA